MHTRRCKIYRAIGGGFATLLLLVLVFAKDRWSAVFPGYFAVVFLVLSFLPAIARRQIRVAKAIAWFMRILCLPVLAFLGLVAVMLNPENDKLSTDLRWTDYVLDGVWNVAIFATAVVAGCFIHWQLSYATASRRL